MKRPLGGRYQRVHFVGVGGTGMAPLAKVFLDAGCLVTGSDLGQAESVIWLRSAGATVYHGHRAENVGPAQLIVVSSAVPADNPELAWARQQGLPVMKRAEVVGELTKERPTIAVAGTHGKTTTSAMAALILSRAGLGPSFLVGGHVPDLGGSGGLGPGEWLVVEADEFDGSFLRFAPRVAVVTNVEADHLDYYGSLEAIVEAFARFISLPGGGGLVLGCADDERVRALLAGAGGPVATYGLESGAEWLATGVRLDELGSRFTVERGSARLGEIRLRVPGRHNVLNALAAVAAAAAAGVAVEAAADALSGFRGASRRFDLKGEARGVTVVDDYGHHPTEITATLAAARTRRPNRLWCVFQPHTYHRTKSLLSEFASALEAADVVVVTDVYMPAGRELDTLGVSGADIVRRMRHDDAHFLPTLEGAVDYVIGRLEPGDTVVTMGAGDVFRVGEAILARLGA